MERPNVHVDIKILYWLEIPHCKGTCPFRTTLPLDIPSIFFHQSFHPIIFCKKSFPVLLHKSEWGATRLRGLRTINQHQWWMWLWEILHNKQCGRVWETLFHSSFVSFSYKSNYFVFLLLNLLYENFFDNRFRLFWESSVVIGLQLPCCLETMPVDAEWRYQEWGIVRKTNIYYPFRTVLV